ncbi:flavin-containing monooxygenase 5-like [Mercenaria mercenaria]|uniref:flavin-containing monooxygenase 5-like n=1 Tax=Mercenaria mercenaria TaxID=6596 RepID=UPI00234F0969|nr:flavin-containing monooxygenase 5-like [Mercenaria mercenaria]
MKKIAVIGAGCSGLTAIKCCLDEGLQPVCFERDSDIGGLWNYSDTSRVGKGSIYKTCVINTSKEMMAFSDFPPPKNFPMFMPHKYVLKYFRMYADKFGLLKHIQFNTSVLRVVQSDKYETDGSWDITFRREGGEAHTETFDGVLICTGHHTFPYQPDFSGLSRFTGTTLHSHGYKENSKFVGKKVVVVGIGNSAVDIAVDLSHVASQVYLSTRRGAWVISRMGFWGLPADAMANNRFLFSLPHSALEWSVEKMANFRFDHESYGLKPMHRALQAHPTINDELPYRIMTGALRVKPNIHHFNENSVQFDDGSVEDIDTVIFATGYEYKIGIVDESVTKVEGNKTSLYKYMFPPQAPHPTLAVVGLVQAIGAVMPISEMQCRWFTRIMKGENNLPSESVMKADIEEKRVEMASTYVSSQRHTLQCFWIQYMDEIATEIGVKPKIKEMFFEDPMLALRCLFGPCVPAQYRLQGPGKWDGAKDAIENTMSRSLAPMKTRLLPKNFYIPESVDKFVISVPKYLKSYFIFAFVFFLFFCMVLL